MGRANARDNGVVINRVETLAPFVTPQDASFSRTDFLALA